MAVAVKTANFVHARRAHDTRVDGENICHRHKSGDTGHDFRFGRGPAVFEMEDPLEETCVVFHE